jgi:TonB family protein
MRLITVAFLVAAAPLIAQDPMDARGWIQRGTQQFQQGQYPQAAASFQRAVQSDPSNVTAHLSLGTAWMQQYIPGMQSPDNAAVAATATREFLKVLELDSSNTQAMSSLASLELNQRKWDQAQAWYEKLVAANPADSKSWYSLGFIAWARWYPAVSQARVALGMKLDDPGPLPAGPVKEDLKTRYNAVLEGGLRALQQGLLIDPKFDDAMAYMNLLIRERADLRDTPEEYQRDISQANDWVDKAMQVKRSKAAQKTEANAMFTAPPPPPPPPPPPGQASSLPTPNVTRIRVGGAVQAAALVNKATPVYPELAKQAGISGPVTLSVVISREGAVQEIRVVSGPSLLAQAAIDAVRQWTYRPTLLNGEPVEVETTVNVNFTIAQ